MKKLFVTIIGFDHYWGKTPFKIGMKLKCCKEPNKRFDGEAIEVKKSRLGTVGYVDNSTWTVATGTNSTGVIAHLV